MKITNLNKYFLISLFVLLIAGGFVLAGETFQNSLLKMELYKTSSGGLNVVLATKKPYRDVLKVNKKSDSEYVILLPETSSVSVVKPVLSPVSTIVKGVKIKTQQYSGQIKGYTKITISTLKPVEITSQAQVFKFVNNQLAAKKPNVALSQKPLARTNNQRFGQKKEAYRLQKHAHNRKVLASASNSTQRVVPRVIPKLKPNVTTSKIAVDNKKVISEPKVVNKPQSVVVPKKVEAKVPSAKKTEVPKVEKIKKTPVETKTEPAVSKVEPAVTKPETVTKLTEKNSTAKAPAEAKKAGFFANVGTSIKNAFKIIPTNVYIIGGAVLVPLLLLLLFLKLFNKETKSLKQQNADFVRNFQSSQTSEGSAFGQEKKEELTQEESSPEAFPPEDFQPEVFLSEEFSQEEFPPEEFPNFAQVADEQSQLEEEGQPNTTQLSQETDIEELFEEDVFSETSVEDESKQEESINNESEAEAFVNNFEEIEEMEENEDDSILNEFSTTFGQDETESEDVSIEDLFAEDETFIEENAQNTQQDVFVFDNLQNEEVKPYEDNIIEELYQSELSKDAMYKEELAETEPEELEPVEEESDEDEILKGEFVIDDEKGFYLVDFENSTALVGHIADEIFVLKNFNKKVDAPLRARLDETTGSSANYMARVGSFKGLVEVTPDAMNLLIEL